MNNYEYDMMPGIRRSDLWYINKTPMHFRWHMDHPEEQTPTLVFGQAAHKLVLEKESFLEEFAVLPKEIDRRTKAGKEAYAAFLTESEGKTVITSDDMDTLWDMYRQLMDSSEVLSLLECVRGVELPYTWTDGETGEVCKCKADLITEINGIPYIVDYKTTTSCEDGAFERACRKYGYDFQCGFYTEGIEKCTLEKHGFIFIAQEKAAPYASRVYWCDDGFIRAGKDKYHELLRLYHRCQQTGDWYGYSESELYSEQYE